MAAAALGRRLFRMRCRRLDILRTIFPRSGSVRIRTLPRYHNKLRSVLFIPQRSCVWWVLRTGVRFRDEAIMCVSSVNRDALRQRVGQRTLRRHVVVQDGHEHRLSSCRWDRIDAVDGHLCDRHCAALRRRRLDRPALLRGGGKRLARRQVDARRAEQEITRTPTGEARGERIRGQTPPFRNGQNLTQLREFERESIDPQGPHWVGVRWALHRWTFHPALTCHHGKGGKNNLGGREMKMLLTSTKRVMKNSKYCTVKTKL